MDDGELDTLKIEGIFLLLFCYATVFFCVTQINMENIIKSEATTTTYKL